MMTEKKEGKRDTKQAIFLAAAELFAQQGYLGASMKDVAKKAGIKAASIYSHYASKEEIMDDLLDHYLKRMTRFHESLAQSSVGIDREEDLSQALDKLLLHYDPEERSLMYFLTRIAHREQFRFPRAAEALIGEGYRDYVNAHIQFFDKLSEAGLVHGTENNHFYGEVYARLSLTFATQFLHADIEPTIPDQSILAEFVHKLVVSHEEKLAAEAAQGTKETT